MIRRFSQLLDLPYNNESTLRWLAVQRGSTESTKKFNWLVVIGTFFHILEICFPFFVGLYNPIIPHLNKVWLVVTGTWMDDFSRYWEFHTPNWLIFFRGVGIPPTRFTFSHFLSAWIAVLGYVPFGDLHMVELTSGHTSALGLCRRYSQTSRPNRSKWKLHVRHWWTWSWS